MKFEYPTEIVDAIGKGGPNGGYHNKKQYRLAVAMLDKCMTEYKSPRLYHLAFTGSTYETHKAFLKKLARHLREHDIKARYRAAREIDGMKGEHLHIMMCVQAAGGPNPDHILNRKQTQWMVLESQAVGIKVYLNQPLNKALHGSNANYMSLPRSNPAKLKDARLWVSYLYKVRGKPASGEVYSSSRESQ
jgi:hypothetical protein